MNLSTVLFLLYFSLAVPAFLLLFKLKYSIREYIPFIIFIWLGLFNEGLSYWLIVKKQTNMVNSNVYILLEYLTILWQFALWKRSLVWLYLVSGGAGVLVWLTDNLILHSIADNNSIFRLFSSLIIVMFSVDQFNRFVVYEPGLLGRNSKFLICTGFILFFSCKAFLESFNLFDVGFSTAFFVRLFLILSVINLFSNLIYAYAILCIPKKQEFTLPY